MSMVAFATENDQTTGEEGSGGGSNTEGSGDNNGGDNNNEGEAAAKADAVVSEANARAAEEMGISMATINAAVTAGKSVGAFNSNAVTETPGLEEHRQIFWLVLFLIFLYCSYSTRPSIQSLAFMQRMPSYCDSGSSSSVNRNFG